MVVVRSWNGGAGDRNVSEIRVQTLQKQYPIVSHELFVCKDCSINFVETDTKKNGLTMRWQGTSDTKFLHTCK
jgi:hypothetical protein